MGGALFPGATTPFPGTPAALPEGFVYLPDAIPDADAHLAGLVDEVPWEDHVFRIFGRTMPMPRRIAWYGEVDYGYSGVIHPARPFSPRIATIAAEVERLTTFRFNTVLVNLYRGGADSMGWHADDDYPPAETAAIASVSFGAARRFDLRAREGDRRASLVLGHGSVLVMGEGTQPAWRHQLPKTRADVGARVNLTFRSIAARNVR
ncbi:MAG: alpha-ketoglutarate-dependent dioxygenase AlkB [Pseudomonadota bacterium]|nr:alpha-ketoglutarate-dependent dioxygenase AlkB [Pseudomonadota bacterium]